MTSNPISHPLGLGITKMPAVDPEVRAAAKELVRDPEAYFKDRREADLRQVRETLSRRAVKLAAEFAAQERDRRRERRHERLRRLFGWLIPRR